MPRASKAARETATAPRELLEVIPRLSPPACLSRDEKAEFRRVVSAQPADWFLPANEAALVAYARCVVRGNRIQARIEAMTLAEDWAQLPALFVLQQRESKLLIAIMSNLRLTVQTMLPRVTQQETVKRSTSMPWAMLGGTA